MLTTFVDRKNMSCLQCRADLVTRYRTSVSIRIMHQCFESALAEPRYHEPWITKDRTINFRDA
jgi:hypothetical protein